ncbi:dTDP-4-dehydrorhamnose reductase [Micromonospora sp. PTRAS2]
MTKWLVTGATGMLGTELVRALRGQDVTAAGHADLDITDQRATRAAVAGHDVVVNCAAWTDVDGAERDPAPAFAVNGLGPALLADACRAGSATLVHVSTDYVFDGRASSPYPHDAGTTPLSAYGRSKLAGEWAVRAALGERAHIVRTAWLYGIRQRGFVQAILTGLRERDQLEVIDDVVGQPTWSRDLARWLIALVDSGAPGGVHHAVSAGSASWYDFARALARLAGADPGRVRPVPASAVTRPAARPRYSVLRPDGPAAAGRIRDWHTALEDAFPSLAQAHAYPLTPLGR